MKKLARKAALSAAAVVATAGVVVVATPGGAEADTAWPFRVSPTSTR